MTQSIAGHLLKEPRLASILPLTGDRGAGPAATSGASCLELRGVGPVDSFVRGRVGHFGHPNQNNGERCHRQNPAPAARSALYNVVPAGAAMRVTLRSGSLKSSVNGRAR
jgi:hypothetical protein